MAGGVCLDSGRATLQICLRSFYSQNSCPEIQRPWRFPVVGGLASSWRGMRHSDAIDASQCGLLVNTTRTNDTIPKTCPWRAAPALEFDAITSAPSALRSAFSCIARATASPAKAPIEQPAENRELSRSLHRRYTGMEHMRSLTALESLPRYVECQQPWG